MMWNRLLVLFLVLCYSCSDEKVSDIPLEINLHDNWVFKSTKDSLWMDASLPSNVHSDLLENGKIPHPFMGDNAAQLQWISEKDWEYRTTFSLDENVLSKERLELHFEGLDTYASIYLNNSLIIKTDNAFRSDYIDVKRLLQTENQLRIVFQNAKSQEQDKAKKLPYNLPEGSRIFTRKAQFQYGWDWGPQLNTAGIWRDITLVAWDRLKIEDVYIKQINLSDEIAELSAEIEINSTMKGNVDVHVYVNEKIVQSSKIQINISKNHYQIPFHIKNPKRWWPHNLGEPYLYDLKIVIKQEDKILEEFKLKRGLRTVELVTEKDTIGESFYFKVNGVPIYAKGANYIPQNSLQSQVTEADYENLLKDVVEANMNMLRVWGGGIYENDIFYDLCDEKGILLWQDFMFACAMYPGDEAFLENVRQEAIENVKRLRNHPSIALWCGNNENSEGWHRWGWQDGRPDAEKTEIWDNYLKVFDSILPNTVAELSDVFYWESSPKYGRGNPKYQTEGDAHDWWVWHDRYPFEHLEKNVPRFMSEFGFQSFPSYEAIRFINQSDFLTLDSEAFKFHQKHIRGFQLIEEYMQRDFPVPEKPEDYVYMSQLLQAYGIVKGIEAHRRAKPYNMGSLYWQLNDCWPAVSWSSIDFFGNWKALHYKAKGAFDNVLVSTLLENNSLKSFIINDHLKAITGNLQLKIMDFEGHVIWSENLSVEIAANNSQIVYGLDLNDLKFDRNSAVLESKFSNKKSYFYFVKPNALKLPKAEIEMKISKTESGLELALSTKRLAKDVFLFTKEKGHFSDNFFDLMPNETKVIQFETEAENLEDLKIKVLNDFINVEKRY